MSEQSVHPVYDWKKSIEEIGPDKLNGVSGLDTQVSVEVNALVEEILRDLAQNPNLRNATPGLIAEAILRGLDNHGLTEQKIVAFFEGVKNE
jgi:hypothetical protein